MENIRRAFCIARKEARAAGIAFTMANYPTISEGIDVLLGMQSGGIDIIELGIPFSDPVGDGPIIQDAHAVALQNGTSVSTILEVVQTARTRGLHVPIVLMGYCAPVMHYGAPRFIMDAARAGVDGFLIADLPCMESVGFRELCVKAGLSLIPVIAPNMSDFGLQMVCESADSYLYVISRMGVTGPNGEKNSVDLCQFIQRLRKFSKETPLALGLGVSTRQDFLTMQDLAEGVVFGSQVIAVLGQAPPGRRAQRIQELCSHLTGRLCVKTAFKRIPPEPRLNVPRLADPSTAGNTVLPSTFEEYGGQYIPELLMDCLMELEQIFVDSHKDPVFWTEYWAYFPRGERPSSLHMASNLTRKHGGASIWLKREDLNHTGSHKVHNSLGQILLAKRLGKTHVLAESASGNHGVITAALCAQFDMECVVYMGARDFRQHKKKVSEMKLLGATVVCVGSDSQTVKDAINEALRAWIGKLPTSHYVLGSAIGPHPFPLIVRSFQSLVGEQARAQMIEATAHLPDVVVSSVDNAVGFFHSFSKDASIDLVAVGPQGYGSSTMGDLSLMTPGIYHGARTYVHQDDHGQILPWPSTTGRLAYPALGPELSNWKDSGRVQFMTCTDTDKLLGLQELAETEGIHLAAECGYAVHAAIELARTMKSGTNIVVCATDKEDNMDDEQSL
ncbi:tryptophan synthase beta subunit-like PLP-dependent enzyme [Penicillium longicatenatum]|uniref:tryptophan synthase beta subunit-like PLP-dependent enzyme n=1 Tax=Penicillium longicatenatum TaxID=1561947 RepID=UPI002549985A|nr:tryptophan synthase beta subunit-like PLP-dependent enzyme [Penicillium longicatenatum]KAJ5643142.1 tryptophan synthase beta subunit-like PLP-dependent enzyme [Penicillium longicatenatum]